MLSKLRTLFWLGIAMLCISFVGIPDAWKMVIAFGVGAVLIALALGLRRDYLKLRLKLKEYAQ
ncbi:MAG TPA: hypothetical protein VGE18_01355 [Candidatus Paceibacterota bacterium]